MTDTVVSPAEWEQLEAGYLAAHPELRAAIPAWADTLILDEIEDDDAPETRFHFTRRFGEAYLDGCGTASNGKVWLAEDGAPDLVFDSNEKPTTPDEMRELARGLLEAADALEHALND